MKIYSVFDKVAKRYAPPFCAYNDGVASRIFRNEIRRVSQGDSGDFALICLGDWTEDSFNVPIIVCSPKEIPINISPDKE